ncbi:hypothetical protein SAMN05660337_2131 [Maridesulfovibrio ferrireducens]|uniref:Cytochrome c domain-containing protein n=1 Tax=Maridesulfovibrio ferrireducens TaxID=246191 RepID=A0A1G9HEX3_9BACT|nr:hypothetical protein [Maridesulfovibrio ferrireducens]SDL11449.1 hypothetical protein SAMN05660337_2131 [Maridesulfovibrio ferrireducens]
MKLLISLLVAGTLLLSGAFVTSAQSEDCSGLIVAKCASCHSLKRVCRALGKKDLAQWQKTNERMVKKGMTVTDAELADINKYLSGATSDDAICK